MEKIDGAKKEKHQQIDSKSKPFAIEKKYKG